MHQHSRSTLGAAAYPAGLQPAVQHTELVKTAPEPSPGPAGEQLGLLRWLAAAAAQPGSLKMYGQGLKRAAGRCCCGRPPCQLQALIVVLLQVLQWGQRILTNGVLAAGAP